MKLPRKLDWLAPVPLLTLSRSCWFQLNLPYRLSSLSLTRSRSLSRDSSSAFKASSSCLLRSLISSRFALLLDLRYYFLFFCFFYTASSSLSFPYLLKVEIFWNSLYSMLSSGGYKISWGFWSSIEIGGSERDPPLILIWGFFSFESVDFLE